MSKINTHRFAASVPDASNPGGTMLVILVRAWHTDAPDVVAEVVAAADRPPCHEGCRELLRLAREKQDRARAIEVLTDKLSAMADDALEAFGGAKQECRALMMGNPHRARVQVHARPGGLDIVSEGANPAAALFGESSVRDREDWTNIDGDATNNTPKSKLELGRQLVCPRCGNKSTEYVACNHPWHFGEAPSTEK